MKRREFLRSGLMLTAFTTLSGGLFSACANKNLAVAGTLENTVMDSDENLPFEKIVKTDAEWKRILTPKQYEITRKGGTEAPYSSRLTNLRAKGTYTCVCCSLPLFSSKTKFNSNTGWASFYAPIKKIHLQEKVDKKLEETRTEVLCNRCDAHLGHVFDDGPKPTGLRYCINGVALKFIKEA
jgi:methionine-R-sulfoxide reductase